MTGCGIALDVVAPRQTISPIMCRGVELVVWVDMQHPCGLVLRKVAKIDTAVKCSEAETWLSNTGHGVRESAHGTGVQ